MAAAASSSNEPVGMRWWHASENFDVDCLVVGGGPAGLTASMYLARYRQKVAVFDSGESRARLIPKSRNYPGFLAEYPAKNC
jgi:thioredoxin reductase